MVIGLPDRDLQDSGELSAEWPLIDL